MSKPTAVDGLTAKQHRFVDEYFVDANGTQAAIRAGYSRKTAKAIASHNLAKPLIATAIDKKRGALARKLEVTAERVLLEYARVGFFDLRQLFNAEGTLKPMSEWTDDAAAAVSSVEVGHKIVADDENSGVVLHTKKLRVWDKLNALEKLGKHLGLFDADKGVQIARAVLLIVDGPKKAAEVIKRLAGGKTIEREATEETGNETELLRIDS